jgi:hypothetical protein
MSTATKERTTGQTTERATERPGWVCENCEARTTEMRKRCAECGTSRY